MKRFPISTITRVFWLSAALPLAAASMAGARDLVSDSPFLPEGFTPPREREQPPPPPRPEPPRGPQPLDQLEFRGLTKLGGETQFSLYNPLEERSFWIGVGESLAGFSVVEFNDDDNTVVVTYEGRTRAVGLREAQVQALEVPRDNDRDDRRRRDRDDDDDDDRSAEERMEELAEEIRRRREVRRELIEQAEQRNNNN